MFMKHLEWCLSGAEGYYLLLISVINYTDKNSIRLYIPFLPYYIKGWQVEYSDETLFLIILKVRKQYVS